MFTSDFCPWLKITGHAYAIILLKFHSQIILLSNSEDCNNQESILKFNVHCSTIAVITVEPADKISFVCNCMQTRLRGQYNRK